MIKQSFKGKGTLIQGDCWNVLPKIKDNSIDFVFIDPHYSLNEVCKSTLKFKGREDMNKIADWDKTADIDYRLLSQIRRVLKPKGNVAIWCAYHQWGDYHRLFDSRLSPYEEAFDVVLPFTFAKANPPPSLRKSSFRQATEWVMIARDKGSFINFKEQKEMKNYMECPLCMGNERVKGDDGKTLHPTQKPLRIYEHLIDILCPVGGVVLDFYSGVGTTAAACINQNRRFICVEIDERYHTAAVNRVTRLV